MAGLKICTRCRAISARRKRRISSSLLPENIGPTTTSIQPIFPLTMSTLSPPAGNLFRRRNATIHLGIIERRERRNHRQAEGILARDQVSAEHAPSTLCVANSNFSRKAIDRSGKFHAAIHHFFGDRRGNFDASRPPKESAKSVAHVRPTLQKHAACAVL